MSKSKIGLALLGAAGLLAACGGGSADDTSGETDSGAMTAPIDNAKDVAADVSAKAAEANDAMAKEHTLAFKVDGMS